MRLSKAFILLVAASAALAAESSGLRGIESADLDKSAAPCTDFFAFANGTWRAKNPIPASMTRWSRRWEAGEKAKEQLKTILDEVSATRTWTPGSVEQLVGDHYAACMDEARIDEQGLRPLEGLPALAAPPLRGLFALRAVRRRGLRVLRAHAGRGAGDEAALEAVR
jgi:putative endopeptidase